MEKTEKQRRILKLNNEESNYVTREAIRDALYILMRKKDFSEIKITEIIERSGVPRSAFYRNFKAKEDILYDTLDELDRAVHEGMTQSLSGNWTGTFRALRRHKEKLNLIIKAGLAHHLLDRMNKGLDNNSGSDFVTAMNNGLIYNVLIYWAKSGMQGTDEEAAQRIVDAYNQIIRDLAQYDA
jgi:AcrR family transcriptional regulator